MICFMVEEQLEGDVGFSIKKASCEAVLNLFTTLFLKAVRCISMEIIDLEHQRCKGE